MIINEENKFLFGGVEKCAATSMHYALREFNTRAIHRREHPFPFNPFKTRSMYPNLDGLPLGKHVPFCVPEFFLEDINDYQRFCLFRNPWEIMVSRYFFFQRSGFAERKAKHIRIARNCSFRRFMHKIEPRLSFVYPVKTFRDFLASLDGRVRKTFVYNFTKIGDIPRDFRDLFGIDISIPKRNGTKHKHYSVYYEDDEKIIEKVRRTFRWGIDLMGFEFNSTDKEAGFVEVEAYEI